MPDIARASLKDLVDRAIEAANAPHVDLAPLLETSVPVRVGIDDMVSLLDSGEPTFKLEVGAASLTIRRQDGGMMAEFDLTW